MEAAASLVRKLGSSVKEVAKRRGSSWWYTPHMAAASRAIAERIPLVDLVLEVRDARIPVSSEYEQMKIFSPSSRRIIVLNKMDLANRSQTKEWMKFFEEQKKCIAFGVNSHNKENIKEFLNFLQARLRDLKKIDNSGRTITALLVGIPNVGKSALANSLHQVGRISAAEKGRLKHAVVSPEPGETKNISGLKIASHPSIYILDTPGVLPPEMLDDTVCSKLTLTGAIRDCVVGEIELARYFLTILNSSNEYKKWAKLSTTGNEPLSTISGNQTSSSELDVKQKRQYPTDHTQDFIVNNVRRALFEAISSFGGNLQVAEDLMQLIEAEFKVLQEIFHVPSASIDNGYDRVASKLLNLYRTGRLGHYTLDPVPGHA